MRVNVGHALGLAAAVFSSGCLLATGPVVAQEATSSGPAAASKMAAPAPAPAAVSPVPDAENIVVLIRTSMLSLNDAIQTGNFTVFRDKLAPRSRAAFSASVLAASFPELTKRPVNLNGLAILAPELTEAPAIDGNGRLLLKGRFKHERQVLKFALMYEAVQGQWMLGRITVAMEEAPAPVAAPVDRQVEPAASGSAKAAAQVSKAKKQ